MYICSILDYVAKLCLCCVNEIENFFQSGSNSLCFLLQFLRRPCNPCPCITEISDIKAQKEGNMRRKDGWEAWHPGMTTRRERTSSDEKQLRVVSVLNMGKVPEREETRQGPGRAQQLCQESCHHFITEIQHSTFRVQSKYSD